MYIFAHMNLEVFIAQLLYRYPCVTVFDFGSFLTEVRSAKIRQATHTFYPPTKVILFNTLLKGDDGLLVGHLSRTQGISEEQAKSIIVQTTNQWKSVIEAGEILSLDNIGAFKKDANGNVVFEGYEKVNYLTEAFGLTPVVSPIIRRNYLSEEAKSIPVVESTEKEESSISKPTNTRRSLVFLKRVGVAASIIFGLGAFVSDYYYGKYVDQETSVIESNVQKEIEERIQKATFFIDSSTLSSVTMTIKDKNLSYHIVAGVFKDEFNAQNKHQELSDKGFKSRVLPKNKSGLYPVSYGSFQTFEEAQSQLSTIREIEPDAWVLYLEL